MYGDLKEEVFMRQPEGFSSNNPNLVCRLKKSLYGLKQAPRCWNEKFRSFLNKFNFKQLESDRSVYKTIYDNVVVHLVLYVDDGLIMSEEGKVIQKPLNELGSMVEIKISELQCFVGLEIKWNRKEKTTFTVKEATYPEF